MKRHVVVVLLLILSGFMGHAQIHPYAVANISSELFYNANSIKHIEETTFIVNDLNKTTLRKRYAICILNQQGAREAGQLVVYYDKLQKVRSIEGKLFDAKGKQIRSLKKKEIRDMSAVEGDLMTDNRMKIHEFHHTSFPYTVEYEVEIEFNHTFFFPGWMPQQDNSMSVERALLTVIIPADYQLRYKSFRYPGKPEVSTEKNTRILKWDVKGLKAFRRPYAAPPDRELTTTVYLAPSTFSIEGYQGQMDSWEGLGKFQYALGLKRDVLPESVSLKVAELTRGIHNDRQKVEVLYSYLQKTTRYVSIQLGLGGWQPLEASFVAKKGYGDCKALTNYMYGLLKAAGISSYPALIFAGEGEEHYLMEDFPSMQFNHMILCVPLDKDTIWLECTDPYIQPGYLGGFTGNRKALLINEDGGVLVQTPSYNKEQNLQDRFLEGVLKEDGSLEMKVQTIYQGMQQDDLGMRVNTSSKTDLDRFLQETLSLSTYHIQSFDYRQEKNDIPKITEELDVTVEGFASVTGKRIFLTPNILNRSGSRMETDSARTADICYYYDYRDSDHYTIRIPEGYRPESLPQEVNIESKFGRYHSKIQIDGNKVIFHRMIERYAGRFPAQDQYELAEFLSAIDKADRSRMVLIKAD